MSIKFALMLFWFLLLGSGNTVAQCIIQTSGLNFGNYQQSQDTWTTATIDLNCSVGLIYRVELTAGNGSYATRKMLGSNGGALLYNLYTRADYAQVWGDGNAGTGIMGGVGAGFNQPLSIFGLIPAGQQLPAGTYSDNLVIIVNF